MLSLGGRGKMTGTRRQAPPLRGRKTGCRPCRSPGGPCRCEEWRCPPGPGVAGPGGVSGSGETPVGDPIDVGTQEDIRSGVEIAPAL